MVLCSTRVKGTVAVLRRERRRNGIRMAIDVTAETTIARPRDEVAAFAMDVANDPVWIGGVIEAKMLTEPPLATGSQVTRVATFLGRRVEYVNEVVDCDPRSGMAMRSIKGPFPMDLSYAFDDAAEGTRARIRVQGEASGFFKLATPVLSRAVLRSITNDLETLKDLLESRAEEP